MILFNTSPTFPKRRFINSYKNVIGCIWYRTHIFKQTWFDSPASEVHTWNATFSEIKSTYRSICQPISMAKLSNL